MLKYNLKYERHTLEEAIELQNFWKIQTQHFLPYNERIVYDNIKHIYYEWLYVKYNQKLKELIINCVSLMGIKKSKKKKTNYKKINGSN